MSTIDPWANVEPVAWHNMMSDNYDAAFREYEGYQGDIEGLVGLSRTSRFCSCPVRMHDGSCTHNAEYVVLEPISGRRAIVVHSNTSRLPAGSEVLSKSVLTHLCRPADDRPTLQNTIGAPCMLHVAVAPTDRARPEARVTRSKGSARRMDCQSA